MRQPRLCNNVRALECNYMLIRNLGISAPAGSRFQTAGPGRTFPSLPHPPLPFTPKLPTRSSTLTPRSSPKPSFLASLIKQAQDSKATSNNFLSSQAFVPVSSRRHVVCLVVARASSLRPSARNVRFAELRMGSKSSTLPSSTRQLLLCTPQWRAFQPNKQLPSRF